MFDWWFKKTRSIDDLRETLEVPEYREFLLFYTKNNNEIINPMGFFHLFRYFHVEKSKNPNLKDIGAYVLKKIKELKNKEFKAAPPMVKLNIKNFTKLWKDLEVEFRHKNRYKMLKEFLFMCSDDDIPWVVRFLCKEVRFPKGWDKIIEEAKQDGKI